MQELTHSQNMEQIRADCLKKVATLLGMPKGITRKAEVIEWLSTCIRTSLPDVLRHCSDDEKLPLAEAAFGGLLHVRLTPLGAYCLGCTNTYEMPARNERSFRTAVKKLGYVLPR